MIVKRTATPRRGRRTLLLLWNLSIAAVCRERLTVKRKLSRLKNSRRTWNQDPADGSWMVQKAGQEQQRAVEMRVDK